MIDLPLATSAEDPLAQPTRARLFQLLGELDRPATTAELARRLGLHPNGIRSHLERLARHGLVERTRLRQRIGRPRDGWTLAPGARPGGQAPRSYADLVRWLARAMRSDAASLRRLEATGREIGRELAPADGGSFEGTLARLGFDPEAEEQSQDRLVVRLRNCPYRDAVRENQEAVCTLHRGLTEGLLDGLGCGAALARFVPRDPEKAGCLIELAGAAAPGDGPGRG